MKVGVLAFQGDVLEHMRALATLGAEAREVRSVSELENVEALIIPGGESTVIGKFLEETGLRERIIERHRKENFPIYGTCAGAILLAKEVFSDGVLETRFHPLGLMDISIERNAYGRQSDSFEGEGMIFIRAPQIKRVGSSVEVLREMQGLPIAVQEGTILASTFHPELSLTPSVFHRLFLTLGRH